jgi:tricorn protease
MDGTAVEMPNVAILDTSGKPVVENRGIAPDREVELDPAAMRHSVDSQVEAAVAEVLKRLQ